MSDTDWENLLNSITEEHKESPEAKAEYERFVAEYTPRKCECGEEDMDATHAFHANQCSICVGEAIKLVGYELCSDCGGRYSDEEHCACGKIKSIKNWRVCVVIEK